MGKIREFYRRIGQVAYYTYFDKKIFVNHAGCPLPPTQLTTTEEYINGVGKYEDVEIVEKTFNKKTPDNYFQVHGHRNNDKTPIQNGRCFNLTEDIEFGGSLRIARLDKNGFSVFYIKNNIFKEKEDAVPIMTEKISSNEILMEMIHNPNIIKKNLNDNVVSFNFDRKIFKNKKWDSITTKARGLFVNVNSGKIVARAWDKFFNIGERDETSYTALKRNMKFPATAYLKENGFLGLIGYNEETDDLFISSKSTNDGVYAEIIKKVLRDQGFDFELAKEICKSKNATIVLEIIDPIQDPHIIEYKDSVAFLLNVAINEFDYKNLNYNEIVQISKKLNIPCKKVVEVFYSWEDFSNWYSQIEENYYYQLNGNFVEGFVIECSDGFMFKIKTNYYSTWKKLRGVLEKLSKGRTYNTSWLSNPLEIQFFYFLQEYGRNNLEGKSIIQMRNAFMEKK